VLRAEKGLLLGRRVFPPSSQLDLLVPQLDPFGCHPGNIIW